MAICPSCGKELPAGEFPFCPFCAAPLVDAVPAVLREERKVVTVLFTDLVGFTGRAERLDPEDVRALLAPYSARLRAEIERHGGTVEKFIGDAVMAVFGVPVAHEDDPERAVRAALAIRDAIRELNEADPTLELRIRTGVNTGEALVALGARVHEGEAAASGDVVNTAARLQTSAPVSGILVGEATYRATRTAIEYGESLSVEAKGKREPVSAWEVVGARSRFGLDVEQQLRAPLVGRRREYAFLVDALARCRSEQTAQLITLVGVPGIGKSRLVAELYQLVDSDPELIWWRQGRSLPYGERLSFWALGEIVKAQAGILESDDAAAAETKLDELVLGLLTDPDDRSWVAKHARPLAGLASEIHATADRAEAFAAWRCLIEALAVQRPLVLVFEDLHWADDGLLDFVDYLADWASGVPLLLVATARPELVARRPSWGGGKRNAATVSIGALSADETTELLAVLLDRLVLPPTAEATVLARAEGNPLYAEEYARILQDGITDPAGDLPLPETVQGMIAARLDALSADEKELVQDAAVIGKVFWPEALIALADRPGGLDEALHALERREFFRRDRQSAVAGETQWAFLHALVRDVASGQIPRARRAELHLRAAAWIESLAPDRTDDRAGMLAHHYSEALALARAAGVDIALFRERARQAFAEASEHAAILHSWDQAESLARAALELGEGDDGSRPELLFTIARASSFKGTFDLDVGLEASDAFLAAGTVERAAEAEVLLSWMSFHRSDTKGRLVHSRRAVDLLDGRPLSLTRARAVAQLARALFLSGESREPLELARLALGMAHELGDPEIASQALNTLGMCRVKAGDEAGLDDLRASVAQAESINVPALLGSAWNNLLTNCLLVGRIGEASDCLRNGRDAARRYGFVQGLDWFDGEAMSVELLRGDLRAALATADGFLSRPEKAGHYQEVGARETRAKILLGDGRMDEALAESELALARGRQIGDPQALGPVLCTRARVLGATGRLGEATQLVDELIYERRISDLWIPELPLALVELGQTAAYEAAVDGPTAFGWRQAGRAVAAGDLIAAATIYERMGARFCEAWARLLAAEAGDVTQLDRAHRYFEGEDAAAFARRCEELLPASP